MLSGRGQSENEAEAFREKNGESSASSFSSGTEKTYQPKEQMKTGQERRPGGQPENRWERKEHRSGNFQSRRQDD